MVTTTQTNVSPNMKPLNILKKGLMKLCNQVQERKAKLEAELKVGQPISESDQEWLDGDGNLVNEEQVIEALEKASDYEQTLESLDMPHKMIVVKLQNIAEGKPLKKQKCVDFD